MTATIEYKGIKFEVEFDHQPYEAEVRYYSDGSGYPGCPESVDVSDITHNETSFMEFLEDDMDDIEILVMETMADDY